MTSEPEGVKVDTSSRFSPSRLDSYEDCPRRYRYRYVDRIKRDARSIEAFLGTCVHKALEELYRALMNGREPKAKQVLGTFESEWEAHWSEDIRIRDGSSPDDWRRIGIKCLKGFFEASSPFDPSPAHEVERQVDFPVEVDGHEYRIAGFIDRLTRRPDGVVEIHDYKTSATLPTQEQVDRDRQLAVYDMAVRHAWPDTRDVRLVWHYLRFGKTLESCRTPEQRAALGEEIGGLIARIKRDREFHPRRSALCDWCEYRDLCPLFRHEEALKVLPPAQRRKDPGVRLVEQYAALDAKRRELREELKQLERELERLKDPIIELADSLGAKVLSGPEGEVAIGDRTETRLPTRTHSPEAFEELESELRRSSVWPEVCRLDPHLLLEGHSLRRWSGEAARLVESLIEKFGRQVRDRTVRLRRIRQEEDPSA